MTVIRRVTYEWDYESFDPETGDVLDHDFHTKCPGLPTEDNVQLVLVRNVWRGLKADFNMSADLCERSWAYVNNGKLPESTDAGDKVPQRFHDELGGVT